MTDSLAGFLSWAMVLLRCLPDDADRDEVSVEVLDLHWDRFQAARDDPAQADRFVTDLAAPELVPPDRAILQRYLRLLRGVAHLERYNAHPDATRTDLDHGIAEVSATLAAVADDGSVSDERLAFAAGLLSMAHCDRFRLDGSPDELDGAVAAAREAVARNDPDEPKPLPLLCLAQALRTVFGSLWPVPDTETSVLMYMVHRYLRVDGLRPADALHRAQRWMRSPDREVPADLPAELRAQCVPRTVFRTVAWAGFTHYGR